mmetsp:Transcript_41822/g.71548  ORF Transcript_41822/g.71548 Transcript_41822/m.71548 type:complete len:133 (+) Transcript_41822:920-1318(+)
MARDFQSWARVNWGTSKRSEAGPSGLERKSSQAEPQQEDATQQLLSRSIEDDTAQYPKYRDMKYADDGTDQGLRTQCTNAGLVNSSSRKDKDTISDLLFGVERFVLVKGHLLTRIRPLVYSCDGSQTTNDWP